MLPDKRDPDVTYKIHKLDFEQEDLYIVHTFPDIQKRYGDGDKVTLRIDLMPRWMQDGIRLMDVAGSGHLVENTGKKVGGTYWFFSASMMIDFEIG